MSLNITNGNTVSLLRKSISGSISNEQMSTLSYSSKKPSISKKFNKKKYHIEYEFPDENDKNIITKGHYNPAPKNECKNQMQIIDSAKKREDIERREGETTYESDSSSDSDSDDESDINIIPGYNQIIIFMLCLFTFILLFLLNKDSSKLPIIGANESFTNNSKVDEVGEGSKIIQYTYEIGGGNTNIISHKPKSYRIIKK